MVNILKMPVCVNVEGDALWYSSLCTTGIERGLETPAEFFFSFFFFQFKMTASFHFKITEGGLGNNTSDPRSFLLLYSEKKRKNKKKRKESKQ